MSGILAGPAAVSAAAQNSASAPAERILDNYLVVQSALARDSLKNVSASAGAMVATMRSDEGKTLPTEVARRAEALTKARSLARARAEFKPLSEALIAYLKASRSPPGTYYEMYCPTAKAEWLQTGKEPRNPYLGLRAATATWGWVCDAVVRGRFEGASAQGAHADGKRNAGANAIN